MVSHAGLSNRGNIIFDVSLLLHACNVSVFGESMATYITLNIIVFVVLICAMAVRGKIILHKRIVYLAIILFILTAIFDSLIIAAGIVAYDQSKILGWNIGAAPVEDFFYSLAAALFIPYMWHNLAKQDKE